MAQVQLLKPVNAKTRLSQQELASFQQAHKQNKRMRLQDREDVAMEYAEEPNNSHSSQEDAQEAEVEKQTELG